MDSRSVRVMRDFRDLTKSLARTSPISSVEYENDSDMFSWRLKLKNFDNDVAGGRNLNADLARLATMTGQDHISFQIRFPPDYPNSPFFCRVVSPRCVMYTGHVTAGGSICLEMLTVSNTPGSWNKEITVAGVMVVVLDNMINCEVARVVTQTGPGGMSGPLRVDFSTMRPGGRPSEYAEQESKAAFTRMMRNHQAAGWNSGVDANTLQRMLQAAPDSDAAASPPGSMHAARAAARPALAAPPTTTTTAAASGSASTSRVPHDTQQVMDTTGASLALATAALQLRRNDVGDAIEWLLEHPDATVAETLRKAESLCAGPSAPVATADGIIDVCSSDADDDLAKASSVVDMSEVSSVADGSDADMYDSDSDGYCAQTPHDPNLEAARSLAASLSIPLNKAFDLLALFGDNKDEALEEWRKDEVSLREVLDVFPDIGGDSATSRVEAAQRNAEQAAATVASLVKLRSDTEESAMFRENRAKHAPQLVKINEDLKRAQEAHLSATHVLNYAESRKGEAAESRSWHIVPGDVFKKRISLASELQIWRAPSISSRPAKTRLGRADSVLYRINKAELDCPQKAHHFGYVQSQFDRSFKSSCGTVHTAAQAYRVIAVEVNENPTVEQRYRGKRKEFMDAGKPIKEELVFHGNPDVNMLDQICAEGFAVGGQDGVAVRHGAAYGNGVYVAKNASVSLGYGSTTLRLLLCKCAVGTTISSSYRPLQEGTHDCVEVPKFALVLKSSAQVLPKYIVHLEKIV